MGNPRLLLALGRARDLVLFRLMQTAARRGCAERVFHCELPGSVGLRCRSSRVGHAVTFLCPTGSRPRSWDVPGAAARIDGASAARSLGLHSHSVLAINIDSWDARPSGRAVRSVPGY